MNVQRFMLSATAGIRAIPVNHPDIGIGWRPTECDGNALTRRTNGDVAVPVTFAAPCRFDSEIVGMQCEIAGEPREELTLYA